MMSCGDDVMGFENETVQIAFHTCESARVNRGESCKTMQLTQIKTLYNDSASITVIDLRANGPTATTLYTDTPAAGYVAPPPEYK